MADTFLCQLCDGRDEVVILVSPPLMLSNRPGEMARSFKGTRNLLARAPVTGLYGRNSQAQSPGRFRDAEIFNVSQEDDFSILFREADERGTQLSTGLTPLIFAQRRVVFIGNGQFRER